MGAEVGATTSTFPYSDNYLHATGRGPVADAADRAAGAGFLEADQGAEYDEVIEIVRPSTYHLLFHSYPSLQKDRPLIPSAMPFLILTPSISAYGLG
jgi:hypothetical protein